MSFFCMNEDGRYRVTLVEKLQHMEFVLDADVDRFDLPTCLRSVEVDGETVGPCAPGSVALVPSTSHIYMMDSLGRWTLFSDGSAGTWTAAEREEFVQEVIAALGKTALGSVGGNVITLDSDHLQTGTTYTVGYEDEDGNFNAIGAITA